MVFALIAILANTITAGRLIFYRRGSSRFRFPISLVAYMIIVCTGGRTIDVIVNSSYVAAWEAVLAVIVAALVWRARGNVAAIARFDHARTH